ncbi:hypothetical protein GUITHDRAFT_143702 [Guillardia theta CCMP2712]|uniref:Uncharacterized protein n=1 Tax=Guillardia theta (strain CCMP2712) TaxID=905079 RepID=L1ITC5_GUITC|nr:hypothetical protein GUITHDRAFT_143702 [Guillardia theta CCMP2712]EKX39090.1 hypothetical protein GUITHDRAFT_143702 [Guillardia theta CCMP2712]|eukprot:XP_005826070.1 hypothetical protein GUITHDRAFT_143702 [Guillardia theta CCMP2712]
MQADSRHVFVLRMAGAAVDEKDESSTTTHHILKFHQMDVKRQCSSLRDEDAEMCWFDQSLESSHGQAWLFRRDPVQELADDKKKKKSFISEMLFENRVRREWKRNWMIADSEDKDFEHAFEARQEADKRSSLNQIINAQLNCVEVKPTKEWSTPDNIRVYCRQWQWSHDCNDLPDRKDLNERQCKTLLIGPGTDVMSKKVLYRKKNEDGKGSDGFESLEVMVRVPTSRVLAVCDVACANLNLRWSEHLKVLDQLKKDEDDLIRILKDEMKNGFVEVHGNTCSYKIEEEGKKQYCYFWLEGGETVDGTKELLVRPVNGDWWNVRKDATRRGVKVDSTETKETNSRGNKTEMAKEVQGFRQDHGNNKKTIKREPGYGSEDMLTGDDLSLNPEYHLKPDPDEDVLDELVKQLSDESEEEEENELDDTGKRMDGLLKGKKMDAEPEETKAESNKADSTPPPKPTKQKANEGVIKIKKEADANKDKEKAPEKTGLTLKIRQDLGKRAASSAPDSDAAAGAKRPKVAAAAASSAPAAAPAAAAAAAGGGGAFKYTEDQIAVYDVKGMSREDQQRFMNIVKKVCLKTQKVDVGKGSGAGD